MLAADTQLLYQLFEAPLRNAAVSSIWSSGPLRAPALPPGGFKSAASEDELFRLLFGEAPPKPKPKPAPAPIKPEAALDGGAAQAQPAAAVKPEAKPLHLLTPAKVAATEAEDEDFEVTFDDLDAAAPAPTPAAHQEVDGTAPAVAATTPVPRARPGAAAGASSKPGVASGTPQAAPTPPGAAAGIPGLGPAGASTPAWSPWSQQPAAASTGPLPQGKLPPGAAKTSAAAGPGGPPAPSAGAAPRPPIGTGMFSGASGRSQYVNVSTGLPTILPPDAEAVLPSAFTGTQFIKLPRQTRVTPEEYREFLSLGHGEIFDVDLDRVLESPWRLPTANPQDFFNYGFNERTWREYCKKVHQYRTEFQLRNKIETFGSDGPAARVAPPPGGASRSALPLARPPPIVLDPDLPPEVAAVMSKAAAASAAAAAAAVASGAASASSSLPIPVFSEGDEAGDGSGAAQLVGSTVDSSAAGRARLADFRRTRIRLDPDAVIELVPPGEPGFGAGVINTEYEGVELQERDRDRYMALRDVAMWRDAVPIGPPVVQLPRPAIPPPRPPPAMPPLSGPRPPMVPPPRPPPGSPARGAAPKGPAPPPGGPPPPSSLTGMRGPMPPPGPGPFGAMGGMGAMPGVFLGPGMPSLIPQGSSGLGAPLGSGGLLARLRSGAADDPEQAYELQQVQGVGFMDDGGGEGGAGPWSADDAYIDGGGGGPDATTYLDGGGGEEGGGFYGEQGDEGIGWGGQDSYQQPTGVIDLLTTGYAQGDEYQQEYEPEVGYQPQRLLSSSSGGAYVRRSSSGFGGWGGPGGGMRPRSPGRRTTRSPDRGERDRHRGSGRRGSRSRSRSRSPGRRSSRRERSGSRDRERERTRGSRSRSRSRDRGTRDRERDRGRERDRDRERYRGSDDGGSRRRK